jgi:hypothetical protein
MKPIVIYLKRDLGTAVTVVRIIMSIVEPDNVEEVITSDNQYQVDVDLITRDVEGDNFIYTMASEKLSINEAALKYFGNSFHVVEHYAWRQLWNSAWLRFQPYDED